MNASSPRLDPRTGAPVPDNFVVPQNFESYAAEDHATWRALYARQRALLDGRACRPFLDGLDALGIGADGIPDFRELSRILQAATGWSVVAVPGLVPDEVFFRHLAERRFPAGHWIRRPHEIDYIEEPDVFHDVFGHVPLLMNRAYADYVADYGRAGLAAAGRGSLAPLARLYWYTVEFALVEEAGELRIFGAGIASSPGETVFALESPSPNRVALDLGRVMRTGYRIDDFQETYFVLPGFDALPRLSGPEFERGFAAAVSGAPLEPGDVLPEDRVLHRGDGAYHGAKASRGASQGTAAA